MISQNSQTLADSIFCFSSEIRTTTAVTESEYQVLGDAVNTDGILYFITED